MVQEAPMSPPPGTWEEVPASHPHGCAPAAVSEADSPALHLQNASSEVCPEFDEPTRQLQWDGWTKLQDSHIQLLRDWGPSQFVERMHRRYHKRIVKMCEEQKDDWMKGDGGTGAPGGDRPGGLVASKITKELDGSGIFVYAAHPSQKDDAEDNHEYSGPRWYITVTEALLRHYKGRKVAPLPPPELQALLWPMTSDQNRPWLTELGWTAVPENSFPQVMHADICYADGPNPRKPGRGRYHHFAWKTSPGENCTTNVVPGAFTEGCADWEHYEEDKWKCVRAPALIFDSEMLHRGGQTKLGAGWTTTLTLQVCSGTGYPALLERVSENMMWYTQPLGWAEGDAVEVFVDRGWQRAWISARDKSGLYSAIIEESKAVADNLIDTQVRCRRTRSQTEDSDAVFTVGTLVEAWFEEEWHPAKVIRHNLDG